MKTYNLLGLSIRPDTKINILEKIKKSIDHSQQFCHIVSVNPEIVMATRKSVIFKKIVEAAQIQIMDGIGIVWTGKLLFDIDIERLQGVDLMETVVKMGGEKSLRIMLIGGSPKVAQELSECYSKSYPKAKFLGVMGISDIKNPTQDEENELFSIVADYMPQIIFVSFGSPAQEIWIEKHKESFKGAICMGVGGAFDFLSGRVVRAPRLIRQIGLEWLFRLLVQPWRIRRQINLLIFIGLILKQKISGK